MSQTTLARRPITLRSVPPSDPPYDDELPEELLWSATAGQPLLDLPLPVGRAWRPVPATARPAPAAGSPAAGRSAAARTGPASPAAGAGPEPASPPATAGPTSPTASPTMAPAPVAAGQVTPATTAATRFVHVGLEVFNGYRPVGHFRALADPLDAATVVAEMTEAMRRLRRRAGHPRQQGKLIKLRRIRTFQPRSAVAEVAAVVGLGTTRQDPAWALAYRLEQRHGRWLCKAARLL